MKSNGAYLLRSLSDIYNRAFFAKTFIPLSTNITKWSNTLKQFGGAFDHFVGLALKVLKVQRILKRSQGSHVL